MQLVYPVREQKDRDFQYGYNQICSALVAQDVIFNSEFNKSSFLDSIDTFLRLQPAEQRPKNVQALIRPKSRVLYFPLSVRKEAGSDEEDIDAGSKIIASQDLIRSESIPPLRPPTHLPPTDNDDKSKVRVESENSGDGEILHIIWPHRWEHDKNPKSFFECLEKLKEDGFKFEVTVLGESFSEVPAEFTRAKETLQSNIRHWGYAPSRDEYWRILRSGHVVVSTAHHEFFGVAMLESVQAGCFPLVPDRLVYPELYAQDCIYRTDQQLYKRLRSFCKKPSLTRINGGSPLSLIKDTQANLKQKYLDIFFISEKKE